MCPICPVVKPSAKRKNRSAAVGHRKTVSDVSDLSDLCDLSDLSDLSDLKVTSFTPLRRLG
jgi:hypothetical protein